MTRIAILTPTLSSADAVSNDVLVMQRLLRERGHEVNLFADHSNVPDAAVRPGSAAPAYLRDGNDVLIYHHSIGWSSGIDAFKAARCRKMVKYHNVTPAEFFEGISQEHYDLCRNGRLQLKDIVDANAQLYLGASAFNKAELVTAGTPDEKTFVVPPFNLAGNLQACEANLDIVDRYNDGTINLLAVAGVRPNKGHAALVEAFATYYYNFNSHARLFMVGTRNKSFHRYENMVRALINSWCIDSRVVFTGEVSDADLKAYYLLSHALIATSEHEGFCVPLVEAMAMKLPIVGYASTAIPETAENAALIWEERDPYLIAQSVDFLLKNESAAMALAVRASRRYDETFSNDAIEKQFFEVMAAGGFEL
ncbi:MAG TPA: glycosyltransferase family 4 protein [Pyrinomonadaceae bacterium]|nr:glycosyltransferase family 4 protein [Pyrinomonadaceae bacterium]